MDVDESATGVDGAPAGAGGSARNVRDDRPVIESRRGRLHAYLRYNGDRILNDTVALAAWILLLLTGFQEFGFPRWSFYTVAFVGVVGYTQLTTSWSRPYTSPDGAESVAGTRGSSQEPKQRHD